MKVLDSAAEIRTLPDAPLTGAAAELQTAEPADPGLGRRFLTPRTLLSFAVAFGLLAFFFSRIELDFGQVVATMARANGLLVLAALVVYYTTFPFRGLRWRAMLRSCGIERPPSAGTLGLIVFLSWFANCLLPAKLGDVYRAYLLRKRGGISRSRAGGTVVAERIVDFAFVLILLGLSALAAFRGRVPEALGPSLEIGAGAVLLAGLALLVMRRWEWLVPRFLPRRFHAIYERFHDGVMGAFGAPVPLVVYTPLGWLAEVLRFWLVAQSVGLVLGGSLLSQLAAATFVALGSALLTSAAPTPGGLGAAELGIVAALALLGQTGEVAVAAALLDRVLSYWSLVGFGLVVYLVWESRHRDHAERIDLTLGPLRAPEGPVRAPEEPASARRD